MSGTVTINVEVYDKMVEELRVLKNEESKEVKRLKEEIKKFEAGLFRFAYGFYDYRYEFLTSEEIQKKFDLTIANEILEKEAISKELESLKNRNIIERILNK